MGGIKPWHLIVMVLIILIFLGGVWLVTRIVRAAWGTDKKSQQLGAQMRSAQPNGAASTGGGPTSSGHNGTGHNQDAGQFSQSAPPGAPNTFSGSDG